MILTLTPTPVRSLIYFFYLKGTSAYAGPHYHKLYGRVIRVWNNRRGQPKRSAMQKPRSGRSPALIRFASPSGKYAVLSPSKTYKSFWLCKIYGSWSKYKDTCVLIMQLCWKRMKTSKLDYHGFAQGPC